MRNDLAKAMVEAFRTKIAASDAHARIALAASLRALHAQGPSEAMIEAGHAAGMEAARRYDESNASVREITADTFQAMLAIIIKELEQTP